MTEQRTSYGLSDWQGYLSYSEIDLIKELVNELPPNPNVLTIGAGAGTCTLAVLEERRDVLYYSVDLLTNEREVTTNEHLRLQETPWAESGHVIRIWGDSHIVGKRWRVPLDMLIIDGDHSEFGIREDLRLWVPHVVSYGYVLVHDYGGDSQWPAVKESVDDWVDSDPLYETVSVADTMYAFQVAM
jgi:hypothetical protein